MMKSVLFIGGPWDGKTAKIGAHLGYWEVAEPDPPFIPAFAVRKNPPDKETTTMKKTVYGAVLECGGVSLFAPLDMPHDTIVSLIASRARAGSDIDRERREAVLDKLEELYESFDRSGEHRAKEIVGYELLRVRHHHEESERG